MYTKFSANSKLEKFSYKENLNWKRVGKFVSIIFSGVTILFAMSIYFQENELYKNELQTEIGKVYLNSNDIVELEDKIEEILNSYNLNIISKTDSNNCSYSNLFELSDNMLVICYKTKQIEVAYDGFTKSKILIYNRYYILSYSIIVTIFITLFFIASNSYLLKKIEINVNKENLLSLIDSRLDSINTALITFKLGKIDSDIKELYFLCAEFIKIDPQNFFSIESKIMKQINVAKNIYLNNQASKLFILFKELEIHYLHIIKNYKSLFSRYFLMLTSKNFTSTYQLSLFILFFTLSTSIHLRLFYEIPRNTNESLMFYITQVFNIFSNLGGELEFVTTVEFLFSIYLQLIGIIFLGILIGIINKEIR
ncbi:MAG: hypothetical protein V3575_02480 [Candidatus Absconditabacteria bacterium]